jgi:hypothetical protein
MRAPNPNFCLDGHCVELETSSYLFPRPLFLTRFENLIICQDLFFLCRSKYKVLYVEILPDLNASLSTPTRIIPRKKNI